MIEINLIPDVKQELIRAKRVRNTVISSAVVIGIASLAIVVLLSVYSFAIQPFRSGSADKAIDDKSNELKKVPDLGNMLTIQSQLSNISDLHDKKVISSRLFELLTVINPSKPNDVTFSQVRLDIETGSIHIDAQALNGFAAAEVLEKTIKATNFSYMIDGETIRDVITEDVMQTNQSFGEDSSGAKVLRFSLDFEYNEALFARSSDKLTIVRPDRQDATDSYKRLPESLFGSRAADGEGTE